MRLLDYDRFTGISDYYDKVDGKVVIRSVQDVEPMLDHNLVDRNSAQTGWKGDMHKVASIPLIVVEQWTNELKRQGRDPRPFAKCNRPFLIAKLNDKSWSKLRTKDGAI